jgi:hypothetical protein
MKSEVNRMPATSVTFGGTSGCRQVPECGSAEQIKNRSSEGLGGCGEQIGK